MILQPDDLARITADMQQRADNPEHAWDVAAVDWPLSENSLAIEIGGYCGRWALQIAKRYGCRIILFDPQVWACRAAASVLSNVRHLIYPFALGCTNGNFPIYHYGTDGCSFLSGGASTFHEGMMIEASQAFDIVGVNPRNIDVAMMNIEGYEYYLIPHMIQNNIMPKRLIVQFHDFGETAGMNTRQLNELIATNYVLLWAYGTTLQAFIRGDCL